MGFLAKVLILAMLADLVVKVRVQAVGPSVVLNGTQNYRPCRIDDLAGGAAFSKVASAAIS